MAYTKKTATEIIEAFELQVNDVTELSTAEELIILDRVYQRICASRYWEFLRTVGSGTMSSDATSYYITIPDDFSFFAENAQYTDNTMEYNGNATPKVIFVGSTYEPVQIVNMSDRRQYQNTCVAYVDWVNNKIRFTTTPSSTTYEFDYIKKPAVLTANDYPVLPGQFHDMLAIAMAVENDILQLSEKARSYQRENEAKLKSDMDNLIYWNAQQRFN